MVRNILEFRKKLSSYLESVIDFDERRKYPECCVNAFLEGI